MPNGDDFIFPVSHESKLYRKFLRKWDERFPKSKEEFYADEEKVEFEESIAEDLIHENDNEVKVEEKKRIKKVWDVKSKKYLIVEL